jgi:signal transduction histidine kinase
LPLLEVQQEGIPVRFSLNHVIENPNQFVKPQKMRIHTHDSNQVIICISSLEFFQNGPLKFAILKIVDLTFMQELEAVKQKKELFEQVTATVSHELLTPIRSIIAFAQILLKKVSDPDVAHKLNLILSASQLLFAQVKLMLDQNLIDGSHFTPRLSQLNLGVLVNETI